MKSFDGGVERAASRRWRLIRAKRGIWFHSACLLCAVLFLVAAFPRLDAYSQSRTVRVGVYQNEPKIFVNEDGQPAGIFVDILNEVAAQEGWTLIYVPCEWASCLQALEEGQLDLMPDVAYSPEREAKYDYHATPVLESWSGVYANPNAPINNTSQLNGKRVAVLRGSIQQTTFQQMMTGFGFHISLIPTESLEEAFALARDGTADAAIANQFFGNYSYRKYELAKTTIVFNPTTLHFATAEGRNHDLLEAINLHLDEWLQEPKSVYYKTLDRWGEQDTGYRVPPYVFWIIGGISGLLLAAAGVILLLRHRVQVRTRHLERANEELQESEKRYQTLARISPVGIFRTDSNGATTYVNPKWREIAGLSAEQAMGDQWLTAVHLGDRERLSRDWHESTQLQKAAFSEYRFVRPDGTTAWVIGQAVPEVSAENQIIGYVGTITDITERVRAETELRRLNVELEERVARRTEELAVAMRKALEADRLKSAFLATMSHELRTPLNSIIGFTGILLQGLAGPLNQEQQKQMTMVQNSARHLLALINDVLDISKIEAGQLDLSITTFDLRASIEKVVNLVSPLAAKKSLDLRVDIAEEVGTVSTDQRRLEQVILNVLNNAVKFTEEGHVHISCWMEEGQCLLSVADTGIGIRQEDFGDLFRPFHQVDTGLSRKHEGTGLGLSICKRILDLMNGSIWVESQVGQGSTFTIRFPKQPGAES